MRSSSKRDGRRVARMARAPMRALRRACDLFVGAMNSCAARLPCDGAAEAPLLVYAAPVRSQTTLSSANGGHERRLEAPRGRADEPVRPRRIPRAVIGRIDEDAPCEFGEEVGVGTNLLLPANRSCTLLRCNNSKMVGLLAQISP